jgi:hypothetical protein
MLNRTTKTAAASVTLVADGRGVRGIGAADQGGAADGSDPGRSGGVDGPEGMGGIQLATLIDFRRRTLILRSDQDTQTETCNLEQLVVGLGDVLAGGDTGAVGVGDRVALILFGPAVGYRIYKRRVGGVEQGQAKVIDPALNGNVPGECTTAKGGQVFNIKDGLAIISDLLIIRNI